MMWVGAFVPAALGVAAYWIPPRPWLLLGAWSAGLLFAGLAVPMPSIAFIAPEMAASTRPIAAGLGMAAAGLFCNLTGAADLKPWARRLAACGALFVGWTAGAGMTTVAGGEPMLRPLIGP